MKIAMHEITTRDGTFEEHLSAYARTGWRHFEINLWHAGGYITEHGAAKTAALVADNGLTCVAATGLGMSAFGDQAAQDADVEQIERYAEVMQALGCRPIVVGCNTPESVDRSTYSAALDTMAAHVDRVAAAAEPFGVVIAVEVNWCGLCRSFRTAGDLITRVKSANVGLVWDPAHFVSTPSRLSDLQALTGDFVHAHLNDITGNTWWEAMDINADRVIPGDGVLPLREWTEAVTATGYDGWHTVELFNQSLWQLDLDTICNKVRDGCRRIWPDAEF